MRIFVTGGTGFIGKPTVAKLKKKGHSLLVLSRQPQKPTVNLGYIKGDLNDDSWQKEVKLFRPDATLHLAWQDLPNYDAQASIKNLYQGLNLFNFLAQIGCKKILTAGSCWEYGLVTGKLTENIAILPMNAFTAAKNSLNFLGKEFFKESQMQFIWGRLFFVYGAGQREKALIPRLINYAKGGEKPAILDPATSLDFIYVEDVAEAIVKLITNKDTNGTYNIGSGHLLSVEDIVSLVGEKFNLKEKFSNLITKKNKGVASLHSGYYADISKIKRDVGWEPKVNIGEGIKKLLSLKKY